MTIAPIFPPTHHIRINYLKNLQFKSQHPVIAFASLNNF